MITNLRKTVEFYRQQLDSIAPSTVNLVYKLELLKGLPFYNWASPQDTQTFNHAIGLPQKNNQPYQLFEYERLLFDMLQKDKHVWVLKATGLGITEFMLRYMAWLCLKDDRLKGSQMLIITGPREDLAIALIDRMKRLFLDKLGVTFDSKDTLLTLNDVQIQSYPSNHLDSARGIKDVSFIFLDEGDFFRIGEQQNARDVSERYIAKSNPYIVMVSTPNAPEGLFESIEREPEETCIYRRLKLDYKQGLDTIYTREEIEQAKASPSFEREYNLKYLGLIGNVFSLKDIDAAIAKGAAFKLLETTNEFSQKSMGIDPGFGSSAFAVVITEWVDSQINVLYAEEFARADYNYMVNHVLVLTEKYGITKSNSSQIFVDGSNPSFIRSLKTQFGEREDYDIEIEWYKHNSKGYDYTQDWLVVPVNFGSEHKQMLAHTKKLMEHDGGQIAINPKFDKLITSLRTAVANEYKLDKQATSYDDTFDAFRLALEFFH